MFELMRDVRHAARRLTRTPMFTVATLMTLALGIGANTAIFTIVNTAILKPLPFHEPDRLVGLWQTAPGVNITDLNASIADYVTYREESQTLAVLVLQQSLVDSLASLPGVSSVSAINGLPMTGFSSQDPISASDHSYAADTIPPPRRFIRTAPGAFQVLGRRSPPVASTTGPISTRSGGDRQAHSIEPERCLE